jgi:hypothetical protein
VTALLLALGIGVILLAMTDIFLTTLTTRGAGPISSVLGEGLWRTMLRLHRRRPAHHLLNIGGPGIMVCIVSLWVLLMWTGWALIFNAWDGAVVDATTGEPADMWARVYFAGFNLFTLGLGDYRPQGAIWQIATALTSINGLLTITLAITYLVPIVAAAAEKRRLASLIAGLGATPADILRRSWDGKSFGALDQHLLALGPMISQQAQQHLAYPVLRYFHSTDPKAALAPRLASLDEALHFLRLAVAPHVRLHPTVIEPTAAAIATFLALTTGKTWRAKAPPPPPSLADLAATGIPLAAPDKFERSVSECADRRRLLLGYVESDGWTWGQVVEPSESS